VMRAQAVVTFVPYVNCPFKAGEGDTNHWCFVLTKRKSVTISAQLVKSMSARRLTHAIAVAAISCAYLRPALGPSIKALGSSASASSLGA